MSSALSMVEQVKSASNYLRGAIVDDLRNALIGSVSENSTHLLKFHGIYQQDDRDIRAERLAAGLTPDYSFMLRLRMPGGHLTAAQLRGLIALAATTDAGTLKLSTRQAIQFHGIFKESLKPLIQGVYAQSLDSIAACGDVNRNVMCTPNPTLSPAHAEVYRFAGEISEYLLPHTRAYHEIWLDETPVISPPTPQEPLYGEAYLPRKFKIAIAIPPHNDVDVYAHDIGLVASIESNQLIGFNVFVGGGLGFTFGADETYPRLGDAIGFCQPDEVIPLCVAIMTAQRDHGDRHERKTSRLKYTVTRMGIDAFVAEVQRRSGITLGDARPFIFTDNGDSYGWRQQYNGNWSITIPVFAGRVADTEQRQLLSALAAIAADDTIHFRLTANQNIIICDVADSARQTIEAIFTAHTVSFLPNAKASETYAIACTALSRCQLAMAEAERYLPSLLVQLDALRSRHGIDDIPLVIRMTGCPNGCARVRLAEIGFIGRSLGHYNLYLGGAFNGSRINQLYREGCTEQSILAVCDQLFAAYAANRQPDEYFGDFVIRERYVA